MDIKDLASNEEYERLKPIQGLLAAVEEFGQIDITHDSLGLANGFHEAQSAKVEVLAYVKRLLKDALLSNSDINYVILRESLSRIRSAIKKIKALEVRINNLVEKGLHENNFPSQRTSLTSQLVSEKDSIVKDLYPFELDIRSAKLQSAINDQGFFKELKESAKYSVAQVESNAAQVEKVLVNLQGQAANIGVEKSTQQFGQLLDHHKKYERNWLFAACGCSVTLLIAVAFAFFYDLSPLAGGDAIIHAIGLLKRIFLISVPAIFLKLCIGKYNSERELRIVYGHRETVLDQYRNFEAGIGDDLDAKNQFRLEIAKYIFSDPRTSYGKNSNDASVVNVNPVVSAVERVLDKK